MAEDENVEAIVIWSERGPSEDARQWLCAKGLTLTPMRSGLLVSGARTSFEAAFGVTLGSREHPGSLPVPPELKGHVRSIGLPPLRRFGKGG